MLTLAEFALKSRAIGPEKDEEEAPPEEAPREAANPAGLLYPAPPSWKDSVGGGFQINIIER